MFGIFSCIMSSWIIMQVDVIHICNQVHYLLNWPIILSGLVIAINCSAPAWLFREVVLQCLLKAAIDLEDLDLSQIKWQLCITTTWRGITCRIAITIEGVENAYLPRNVHFQYRPQGDIGVAVVAGVIRNASRWLDERITWCPLFGGFLSQVRAQAREDLSTRLWLTNSIWD